MTEHVIFTGLEHDDAVPCEVEVSWYHGNQTTVLGVSGHVGRDPLVIGRALDLDGTRSLAAIAVTPGGQEALEFDVVRLEHPPDGGDPMPRYVYHRVSTSVLKGEMVKLPIAWTFAPTDQLQITLRRLPPAPVSPR